MNKHKTSAPNVLKGRRTLRLGFLPENDCAPLIVAYEFGLYKKYGLDVEIQSEPSWKRIHDRIVQRALDAGHVPGMLPFLISLGLLPDTCECATGLVLNLQGNAITISKDLWRLGVRDAPSLRDHFWEDHGKKTYTFGVSCPLSTQYVLLCQWLRSADALPDTAVRIEAVPPEQMFPLLKLGYLDGYCAGEPWTSVAVQAGVGVCIATSAMLAPLHPEKILMVRKDFAETRPDEHERLVAALLEACYLCDQPENRPLLCELLAQPQFVNAPIECLEPDLVGPFGPQDSRIHSLHGLNIFHRCRANEPTAARAAWLTGRLFQFLRWRTRPPALNRAFRPDIFRRAQRLLPENLRSSLESAEPPRPARSSA